MIKATIAMLIVFSVIGLVLLLTNKLNKIDSEKRHTYKKYFWYFYGIIFILGGVVNLFEKVSIIFLIQLILGVAIIILNFIGKIETKPNNIK